MIEPVELGCPKCGWKSYCGPPAMIEWLKRAKLVRRNATPDIDLLGELFRAGCEKFQCPDCSHTGLTMRAVDAEDDEAWGMARVCESCKRPIDPERLEVFPDTRLCVACQGKSDRGESFDAVEYCPRCGNMMALRQTRSGVTRYVMTCPVCRKEI